MGWLFTALRSIGELPGVRGIPPSWCSILVNADRPVSLSSITLASAVCVSSPWCGWVVANKIDVVLLRTHIYFELRDALRLRLTSPW